MFLYIYVTFPDQILLRAIFTISEMFENLNKYIHFCVELLIKETILPVLECTGALTHNILIH